jgi:lauroyl/myristoyl acyltransferase
LRDALFSILIEGWRPLNAVSFQKFSFRAISALTRVLPRRVQYACSRPISALYCALAKDKRRAMKQNLRGLLGPDVSDALLKRETRGAFRSFGYYLCEFFSSAHWPRSFFDEHVIVTGRENLDAALAKGRGAIFCPGHYSSWELGAMIVAHMGYPITAVVQEHGDPENHALFVKQREAKGVHVVASRVGAVASLRALRANQTVALMGDRTTGGPVVPVEFLGRRAWFPQGPWRIALTKGAVLLPTFITRRENNNFTLDIGAALEHPAEGSLQQRMQKLAQDWTRVFEARLKSDPSQWAAFYDVWAAPWPAGAKMDVVDEGEEGGAAGGASVFRNERSTTEHVA